MVLDLVLAAALVITPPTTGEELVRAMQQRYAGKWYKTLTFVQTTTFTEPSRVETWYESARIPGVLRIDVAPLDSGRTILFKDDSIFQFRNAKPSGKREFIHPLMVLGFDVYGQAPEATNAKLKGLGFDLSKLREDTWQGRPAYVVGAAKGDTTSAQFWVDKERLVFVRLIEPAPDGSGGIFETLFNKYQPLGKGWISIEVLFSINGELKQQEAYAEVKGDAKLPEELFSTTVWSRPAWIGNR